MNQAEFFTGVARLIGEPMLLVRPDGEVVAASAAARAEFGLDAGASLADIAEPGPLADFLRRASGSAEPLLGVLRLSARGGVQRYRCDGARLCAGDAGGPLVQLRIRPAAASSGSFALLTRKLDELAREIRARQSFEAELSEALASRTRLVRELHHRVRNNLQLALGLLRREARRAGDAPTRARLDAIADRIHALGFVQKQMSTADDLSHADADRLIADVVAHLHPGPAPARIAVEPVPLPLAVATPLALLLTEFLAAFDPDAPFAVEGRREDGRLVLTITGGGEEAALAAVARDRFVTLLTAQLEGAVRPEVTADQARIGIEIGLREA